MSAPRPILHCCFVGLLGTIPGIVLVVVGLPRIGVAMAAMGAIVAAALALPGISPGRTFRLLAAFFIAKNVPFGDAAFDAVDRDGDLEPQEGDASDRFDNWLVASHVKKRRGWLVAMGVVLGACSGIGFGLRDMWLIEDGKHGLFLPLGQTRAGDSLLIQIALVGLAWAVWGGAAAALVASTPYRRAVLLFGGFGAFLSSGIALAASSSGRGNPSKLIVAFSTLALLFALVIAAVLSPDDNEDDDGDEEIDDDEWNA